MSEQSATKSKSSNSSGDLSLSCSVSFIGSEKSEVSEVEGDLETVELYQFEPVAIVIHQQSQIQRQKMTTLETKKDSAAETGKNLYA